MARGVSEDQDDSDWLRKSTDDGRSVIQPSFQAELTSVTYGEQWVKDKASLMHIIQVKEADYQQLNKELAEKGAKLAQLVSEHFCDVFLCSMLTPI